LSVKWGTSGTANSGIVRVDVRYQGNSDIKLTRFIIFSDTTDANTICTPISERPIDLPDGYWQISTVGDDGTFVYYSPPPIYTIIDNQIYADGKPIIGVTQDVVIQMTNEQF